MMNKWVNTHSVPPPRVQLLESWAQRFPGPKRRVPTRVSLRALTPPWQLPFPLPKLTEVSRSRGNFCQYNEGTWRGRAGQEICIHPSLGWGDKEKQVMSSLDAECVGCLAPFSSYFSCILRPPPLSHADNFPPYLQPPVPLSVYLLSWHLGPAVSLVAQTLRCPCLTFQSWPGPGFSSSCWWVSWESRRRGRRGWGSR